MVFSVCAKLFLMFVFLQSNQYKECDGWTSSSDDAIRIDPCENSKTQRINCFLKSISRIEQPKEVYCLVGALIKDFSLCFYFELPFSFRLTCKPLILRGWTELGPKVVFFKSSPQFSIKTT